jgi:uncharacterized lipoprotein YmbA
VKPFTHALRLLLATACVVMLAGCVGGTRSPAPDYYLLTSQQTNESPARPDFTIGVGPVRIAPFLSRPQIVVHEGGGVMKVQRQRWGESLEHGIQRVLLQNLAALTGAQGRAFPWRRTTAPDFAVRVDITDLDRLTDNSAQLEVSWVLEDLRNQRIVATQQTRFTTAISGNDMPALVQAYSTLLMQLAQQIQRGIPAAQGN